MIITIPDLLLHSYWSLYCYSVFQLTNVGVFPDLQQLVSLFPVSLFPAAPAPVSLSPVALVPAAPTSAAPAYEKVCVSNKHMLKVNKSKPSYSRVKIKTPICLSRWKMTSH